MQRQNSGVVILREFLDAPAIDRDQTASARGSSYATTPSADGAAQIPPRAIGHAGALLRRRSRVFGPGVLALYMGLRPLC